MCSVVQTSQDEEARSLAMKDMLAARAATDHVIALAAAAKAEDTDSPQSK